VVVVVVVVVVAVGGVWCGTDGAAMLMRKAFRGAYPSRWLNCVAFVGFLNALAIIGWQVVMMNRQAGQGRLSLGLLQISFGMFAVFLSSTSFYAAQLESRNWLAVNAGLSAAGCLFDFLILSYHALGLQRAPELAHQLPHCAEPCVAAHAFFGHAFMSVASAVHLLVDGNALAVSVATLRPSQWVNRILIY